MTSFLSISSVKQPSNFFFSSLTLTNNNGLVFIFCIFLLEFITPSNELRTELFYHCSGCCTVLRPPSLHHNKIRTCILELTIIDYCCLICPSRRCPPPVNVLHLRSKPFMYERRSDVHVTLGRNITGSSEMTPAFISTSSSPPLSH